MLVRGQRDDIHTNNQSARYVEPRQYKENAHKWSPLKSPNAITLPSPLSRPRVPAGTSALPEKRFGGKGQSAVVGAANSATLTMNRRKERRRGGRKRLGKRMRMGSRS